MNPFVCRVCGYELSFAPWGKNGTTPTFDYCPCCGIEFGIQDWDYEPTKQQRERWLAQGAPWAEIEVKPREWDIVEQLENVLPDRASLLAALRFLPEDFDSFTG